MKNKEVLLLSVGISNLRRTLSGRTFTHAVVLNRNKLEVYVKALEEARKPSDEMKVYLDKFEALKLEYATKDAKGKPILCEGRDPFTGGTGWFYDLPQNDDPNSEYTKKRMVMNEESKTFIDTHNEMMVEWGDELLEKDSEFNPTMIDIKDAPDEITTEEMAGIIYMIND